MFKKLLLIFLSVNILLLSGFSPFVRSARAQESTWFRQSFYEWYTKVYDTDATPADEIYGERYTAAQVEWVIYGIWAFWVNQFIVPDVAACLFAAVSDLDDLGTCLIDSLTQLFEDLLDRITYNPNNINPALALDHYSKPLPSMVFESRPLSGITYVKDKFNLVGEVYAQQGFGFSRLEFIQPLWQAARDISFFFLVLATVIMAFMIMFRVKLSPQTVISIQSAIPKVVMGIILITFSYAIAGFMIDLVYVTIGLLASMFDLAIPDVPGIVQSGIYYRLMTEGIPFIGLGAFGLMILYLPMFFISFTIAIVGNLGVLNLLGIFAIAPLISMVVTLIVLFVLLFITIKILWMLIKTVVAIFLLVIFGPVYILGGVVFPSFGFGSWIKQLASNLAVYPVAGAMFILSYMFLVLGSFLVFLDLFNIDTCDPGLNPLTHLLNQIFNALGFNACVSGNVWQPPLTLNGAPGGTATGLIFCFVSLSILFLIPKTADIIKGLISGRPYAYGTAIGEAFGPAAMGAAAGWGYISGGPAAKLRAVQEGRITLSPEVQERYRRMDRIYGLINQVTGFGRRK